MTMRARVAVTLVVAIAAALPTGEVGAASRRSPPLLLVRFAATDGFTFSNSVDINRDGRAALRCSAHSGPRLALVRANARFRLTPGRLASLRRELDDAALP